VAEGYPEQSVPSVKARARLSAFQHGELLAQGDVFQAQPVTGENQPSQISGEEPHKREHASILADRNCLIQHTYLILMTDTDHHSWRSAHSADCREAILLMTTWKTNT